jgi:hypothetical protein
MSTFGVSTVLRVALLVHEQEPRITTMSAWAINWSTV